MPCDLQVPNPLSETACLSPGELQSPAERLRPRQPYLHPAPSPLLPNQASSSPHLPERFTGNLRHLLLEAYHPFTFTEKIPSTSLAQHPCATCSGAVCPELSFTQVGPLLRASIWDTGMQAVSASGSISMASAASTGSEIIPLSRLHYNCMIVKKEKEPRNTPRGASPGRGDDP